MTTKKYTAKYDKALVVPIKIGEKQIACSFEGGQRLPDGRLIRGVFKTSDVKVQEALEKSTAYDRLFTLERGKIKETKGDPKKKGVKQDEQGNENAIEGITNGQEARKYINKTYNIPLADIPNNEKVKEIADEKGITFPDWE